MKGPHEKASISLNIMIDLDIVHRRPETEKKATGMEGRKEGFRP